MASITLNKPSGGQLTLSPEDGTSTETVTIPSVGVKAADEYPSLDFVTPVNPPYYSMGSTGHYALDTIEIPSAGKWRIYSQLRWGFSNSNIFLTVYLSTNGASTGQIGSKRMQFERIATATANSNVEIMSEWLVDMGTELTFPYTIHLMAYESGSGTCFLQNDSNGYNSFGAFKIAETTTSSGTPSQIGAG